MIGSRRSLRGLGVWLGVLLVATTGLGLAQEATRDFRVEELANERPSFQIRVWADRPELVYEEGDHFTLQFQSERDCYLHLFNIGADGKVSLLFPNELQPDNSVRARQPVRIPPPGSSFAIVARPPFGREYMVAVATTRKLNLREAADAGRYRFGKPSVRALKDFVVELSQPTATAMGWAEHHIAATTVPRGGRGSSIRSPRRVAVCIGISRYRDTKIRNLYVADKDAREMGKLLASQCGFDVLRVLVNEQATLAAVRELLASRLPAETKPGDTVLVYWSGHGDRVSDVDGDEPDGLDEYLIVHDSVQAKPETALLDDTFAAWMAALDGRKIVLVLDNCYAGGAAKGISLHDRPIKGDSFDFIDGEFRRAKDLGRRDAVLLAASTAQQQARERRDGRMSVMTYFLGRAIEEHPRLSVADAYRYVSKHVPPYVRENYAGAEQTPVLEGDIGAEVLLKGHD